MGAHEQTSSHTKSTMVAKGATAKGKCGDPQPSCGHKMCHSLIFFALLIGALVMLVMAFTGTLCLCDDTSMTNNRDKAHAKKCSCSVLDSSATCGTWSQASNKDCCAWQDESDGSCLTAGTRLYLIIGGAACATISWIFLCAWCACCCFAPDQSAMAPTQAAAPVAAPVAAQQPAVVVVAK